ncbi:MAG: MBL fold metallo-hydrolase [Acidobacteriota bacterium]
MRLAVLGSGSAGNSLIVESGNRRLLVDAGFSCLQLQKRLASLGTDIARLDALLLTHEHQDHLRGADVLLRRYSLPVYATQGTLDASGLSAEAITEARAIRSGKPFEVPESPVFWVEAFGIPHDANEPVGFVIEDLEGCRLGVVTDMGSRSQLAWGRLQELDCLVIETNHDLQMLRTGPYPWHLKQRVAGRHGHLSNREAAEGVAELMCERLSWVVLYHLSRTNNLPALAAQAMGECLDRVGSDAQIVITQQDEPTPWLEVRRGQTPLAHCVGQQGTLF